MGIPDNDPVIWKQFPVDGSDFWIFLNGHHLMVLSPEFPVPADARIQV